MEPENHEQRLLLEKCLLKIYKTLIKTPRKIRLRYFAIGLL